MSNLTVRILSAVLMLAVGLTALTVSAPSRWALITAVLALGAWEFGRMLDVKFAAPRLAPFAGVWVACLALLHWPGSNAFLPAWRGSETWVWGWAIIALLVYTLAGFYRVGIETLAPWLFMNLFGLAYLGLWGSGLFHLVNGEPGWRGIFPLLVAYAGIALTDIGAYASGRAFGKRKLCPQISAKKTVEGAVGGACIGTLTAAVLAVALLSWTWVPALLLGLGIALSAIVGDLFISILKRYTGAKDSSRIIPGHGGVLDRFDSVLFTGPIAAFGMHALGSIFS